MINYKEILSEIQYKAVANYNGASLVIAGAGSGKTRVLTYRIAYMIENGVEPSSILSLTFTTKAAEEMRERIKSVVSYQKSRQLWMGTFHSVFSRILRAEAAVIGFTDAFTIYDSADSRNLINAIIKEMRLDEKKYEARIIVSRISLAKNGLVTPQMYSSNASSVSEDIKQGFGEFHNIYRTYMIRCKQTNVMDFDDLLLYTNILFRNEEVVKKYQQIFKYILVDEYQDTNSAQYRIVQKLAEGSGNLCVVGDDAQSIYSFRGAKIENILRFRKDYPKAMVIALEENYRSTQTIVNAANAIIANNKSQLKKTVFSKKEIGEQIALRRAYTDKQEALEIRRIIEAEFENGAQYKDIAILYRTNAQSKVLEDELRVRQIPYRIHKGQSFYQHAEIKHILAYVRLIANAADDEAFKRIVNIPVRGIGKTSMEMIINYAKTNSYTLWDAVALFPLENIGIKGSALRGISTFVQLIEKYRQLAKEQDAYALIHAFVSESGIIQQYRDTNNPEKESAYQNIEELINSIKQQCDNHLNENNEVLRITDWIKEVILLTSEQSEEDKKAQDNKVTLMTIHSAKGLEFDVVFIAGVEEGMFPAQRSAESLSELEEERRLFYVAVTRAIRKLVISYSLSRYKWGTLTNTSPSRFVKEIDAKFYDKPEFMTSEDAYCDVDNDGDKKIFANKVFGNTTNSTSFTKDKFAPRTAPQPQVKVQQRPPSVQNMKRVGIRSEAGQSVQRDDSFAVGDMVTHDKFGQGVIQSMERTSTDMKVAVEFKESGLKNLLLKFAKLKKYNPI